MASITPISGSNLSAYDGGQYQNMRGVAVTPNGAIIYISLNGVTNIGVIKSTNYGSTWSIVYPVTTSFTSIACSSDGNIVYAAWLGGGLYKSINAGTTWNKVTFLPDNTLPGGAANPESPAGGVFPGYKLDNNYQIACDSTGTKLIMTTNAAASIYQSVDGGSTWSFKYVIPGYSTNPNTPTYITSNATGSILYAALNNTTAKNIIVSKNSGTTWAGINMLGVTGPFGNIQANSYGDFLFAIGVNSVLNIFYPTHVDKAVLTPSGGNTYVALGVYNDGNGLMITQNNYQTFTNGAGVLYAVTNKYSPGEAVCFKEDTKILCFKEDKEVYVKVQDIRKGDLIKTLKNGYVSVDMIGTSKLYNSGNTLRGINKLYVCSVDKYPELIEDLVITGCHSILTDNITEKQREYTLEILGQIMITDNKYRLIAFLDERTEPYSEEGVFNIWHIALENNDYYMNYGIYANGLLVETCSKRTLKELSGMELIE